MVRVIPSHVVWKCHQVIRQKYNIQTPDHPWSIYLWINNTSFGKFIIGGLLSSNILSRRKRRKLKAKPINKEKLKKIFSPSSKLCPSLFSSHMPSNSSGKSAWNEWSIQYSEISLLAKNVQKPHKCEWTSS